MATAIEVILTEDSQAGRAGELIKVKPGYARNYLLPKSLAVVADDYNMAAYEERKAELEKAAQEKREKAEKNKEAIGEEANVSIEASAGETGKLFGAVTKEKIAEAITEQLKVELTKDGVKLQAPIKAIGDYDITIDLGSHVETKVQIKVVPAN